MKRILSVLLCFIFLFSFFSIPVSASGTDDQFNFYPIELIRSEAGFGPGLYSFCEFMNYSSDFDSIIDSYVVVGRFSQQVQLLGFTRVSDNVFVGKPSESGGLRFFNSGSSNAAYYVDYVYAVFRNKSYSISSALYNDTVSGLGNNPSVLPSSLSNVTFPDYWTNFSTLQLVLNKNDVIGSSNIEIPLTLSGFSSPSTYVPDVNCQVFSGGLPVSFSLSLDPVRESSEEVGYGILSLNGPFFDDVIITLTLGDVFSPSDTFTLHIDKPVSYLNFVLTEEQVLKSINELLGSNFSSINSLLGQINSGIGTSNSLLNSIWSSITSGFQSVGNWFSTTWTNLSGWFATTWNNMISGFNSVVSSVVNGAQDIVDALWDLLGPAEPEPPPGSDVVGDLGSLEEGLFGDTEAGRNDFNNVVGNAGSLVSGLGAAFGASSVLISYFLNIPFVNTLLTISLSLGVFATFVGLAMSFRSTYEKSQNAKKAEQRKQARKSGG